MSIPPPLHEARIALLIDADNAPAAKIDVILAELAKIGVANIRRAYGNWKKSELRGWEEVLHDYAIRPIQQFDYSKGKNATDMGMVIDAMDLLYTDRPEAFGIVSSDSDFTPLVLHLKAKGAKVYGFGAKKTPLPFVNACSRFLYLENIGQSGSIEDAPEVMLSTPSSSRSGKRGRGGRPGGPNGMAGASSAANASSQQGGNAVAAQEPRSAEGAPLRMDRSALKRDARLVTLLRNAVESAAGEDGWSALGAVGQQIGNQASFDPRNYGYRKLIDLIDATQLFDLDRRGTQFVLRDKRQGGSPMPTARSDMSRDGGRESPRDAAREPQPDSPRDFQRDASDAARDVFLELQREDAQGDEDPSDDPQDDQDDQDVDRDVEREDDEGRPERSARQEAQRDVPRDGRRDSPRNAPRNGQPGGRRDAPRDARADQTSRGTQAQRDSQRDAQRDPQRDAQRAPQRENQRDSQRDGQRDVRRDPQRDSQRDARRDPQGDAARSDRAGAPPQGRPADRHPFELPADSPARQFANAFRDPPFQAWEPEFDEPAVQAPLPAEPVRPSAEEPAAKPAAEPATMPAAQPTAGPAVEQAEMPAAEQTPKPAAKRRTGRAAKAAPMKAAEPAPAEAPAEAEPSAIGRGRRPKKATTAKALLPASSAMADDAAAEPAASAGVESSAPAKKRPARKSTRPAAKKAPRREA